MTSHCCKEMNNLQTKLIELPSTYSCKDAETTQIKRQRADLY